ncbi:prophage tail gpP-like protein [Chromobacterium alkanivorans]|uniref:phage baseplate assembly protein n=1 Tax=Chromobacterium alkanivorans TaxID=1071719 RepID=UPI002166D686|nr:phage tail protein [Chromobacterium alkanivorans]MCS3803204.1 prophage tail gpP-like protein [Chromobacterium alkanivorans]MCS3817686.1 prophage tail gpP-like protein [Chromobacterium alkanivorans]MCS3872570.1 prophage tail gpP-like protein [Chromobacterium alkanivorans]
MATPAKTVSANNEVSLEIAGKAHRYWTQYSIDSDLTVAADAWQVSLGLPGGEVPPAVEPGAEVKVLVGADVVLQGRVDDISHSIGAGSHQLTLSGRDLAGMLLDCSAPLLTGKGMTLSDVLENVIKPLGVSRLRVDAKGKGQIEKISVDPGNSAWDVLTRAAAANGLAAWFDPDGTLVVGGPDYSAPAKAKLILCRDGKGNNVLSLAETRSHAPRYSQLTLLGQGHRQALTPGRHDLKHQSADPDVRYHKPRIVVEPDAANPAELAARADKMLADARLAGYTLSATVAGHRNSAGELWTPGQRIQVESEPHGIKGDTYFLMARTFSGGRGQGCTTRLTLKEDGRWLPAMRKR